MSVCAVIAPAFPILFSSDIEEIIPPGGILQPCCGEKCEAALGGWWIASSRRERRHRRRSGRRDRQADSDDDRPAPGWGPAGRIITGQLRPATSWAIAASRVWAADTTPWRFLWASS